MTAHLRYFWGESDRGPFLDSVCCYGEDTPEPKTFLKDGQKFVQWVTVDDLEFIAPPEDIPSGPEGMFQHIWSYKVRLKNKVQNA